MKQLTPQDLVIVGFARTPFGRFGGTLRDVPLPHLGAVAVRGAMLHAGVAPESVDEVAIGVNLPGSDRSIARQIQLRAGIPVDRVSYTVDRACCSSLAATALSARGLRAAETDVVVSGGAENLSMVPYFVHAARWGKRIGPITLDDQLVISCPHTGVPRAVQAGEEAVSLGIGRDEQDEWALRSQRLFAMAQEAGHIEPEIVPVRVDLEDGVATLDRDECPRPQTTPQQLAKLETVYGSPTVTAGNAPNMSTGATAIVMTRAEVAERDGLVARARLRGFAAISAEPQGIASAPAKAAQVALERTGLRLDDIDAFEINEAFAAVPLVTTHVLSEGDHRAAAALRQRTNLHGGAIAVGHPTGATAARLIMTLIGVLRATGGSRGLVTICGGIGEAEAVIVELL